MTAVLVAFGLTLATAGTVTLIAWRHRRGRARVPAILFVLAAATLAVPGVLAGDGGLLEPSPEDATDAVDHPHDAVVPPGEIQRR